MDTDRFPFDDSPNTACFTCRHVLDRRAAVAFISHDDDGYWQFLCKKRHRTSDGRIVSLEEILTLAPDVAGAASLDFGHRAESDGKGGWREIE